MPRALPAPICNLCQITFTRASNARRHYNSQHNRDFGAKCPVDLCTKSISNGRKDSQRRHMETKHPDQYVRRPWIPLRRPNHSEAQSRPPRFAPSTMATTTSGKYGDYSATAQSGPSNAAPTLHDENSVYYSSQAFIEG